jgi:hypothetical protein
LQNKVLKIRLILRKNSYNMRELFLVLLINHSRLIGQNIRNLLNGLLVNFNILKLGLMIFSKIVKNINNVLNIIIRWFLLKLNTKHNQTFKAIQMIINRIISDMIQEMLSIIIFLHKNMSNMIVLTDLKYNEENSWW